MENNYGKLKNYFLNIYIVLSYLVSSVILLNYVNKIAIEKNTFITYIYIVSIIIQLICLAAIWKSKLWGFYGVLSMKMMECFLLLVVRSPMKQILIHCLSILIIIWLTKDIWYKQE